MMGFVSEKCYKCGVRFGLEPSTEKELRHSGATFYCPYGHGQRYIHGPSEAEKLRGELNRLRQDQARLEEEKALQQRLREDAERSARAYKGVATKMRNRVKHGVCPCCNRTFKNLARHMETQHPEFQPEPAAGEEREAS